MTWTATVHAGGRQIRGRIPFSHRRARRLGSSGPPQTVQHAGGHGGRQRTGKSAIARIPQYFRGSASPHIAALPPSASRSAHVNIPRPRGRVPTTPRPFSPYRSRGPHRSESAGGAARLEIARFRQAGDFASIITPSTRPALPGPAQFFSSRPALCRRTSPAPWPGWRRPRCSRGRSDPE